MISDSITSASATAAPSTKDFGKKKRANRSAKLKQCKLDARREQWLSQVAAKNKGSKEEMKGNRKSASEKPDERDNPIQNLDRGRREEDNGGTFHHESYMESPANSPTSTILDGTDSSPNFSGSSSRSSSSSSSGGCCSGNITEEEDGDDDDGCLDDWEAVADALAAADKHGKDNPPESCEEHEPVRQPASPRGSADGFVPENGSGLGITSAKQDCLRTVSRNQRSNRAWRPDDELRPQSLPNLSKQLSFPAMDRHFSSVAVPLSCPICYEDLDLTDSNFLPCPCGFRLCLFCHKRICDGDGRCPGCRKPYDHNAIKAEASVHGSDLTIRLVRSSSMFCRS